MATANPVGARGPKSAILDDRRYKQYASLRDTEFTSKPPLARRLNFRRAVTQSDLHQEAERPRVGFRCTEISDAECTTPASADIIGLQRVISDAVRIDPDACRAMLASRELTPAQRLTILVALGTGLSAASFAALRRNAERAVAEAGSIEAAIMVLARAQARSPEEMTNER